MQKRPENVILKKTEDFSDRIVKMYKYLQNKREGNVDKSIVKDNEEIINILVKITGTLKRRMQK